MAITYVSLRDQGYDPALAQQGVMNAVAMYNMFKKQGTEDQRRQEMADRHAQSLAGVEGLNQANRAAKFLEDTTEAKRLGAVGIGQEIDPGSLFPMQEPSTMKAPSDSDSSDSALLDLNPKSSTEKFTTSPKSTQSYPEATADTTQSQSNKIDPTKTTIGGSKEVFTPQAQAPSDASNDHEDESGFYAHPNADKDDFYGLTRYASRHGTRADVIGAAALETAAAPARAIAKGAEGAWNWLFSPANPKNFGSTPPASGSTPDVSSAAAPRDGTVDQTSQPAQPNMTNPTNRPTTPIGDGKSRVENAVDQATQGTPVQAPDATNPSQALNLQSPTGMALQAAQDQSAPQSVPQTSQQAIATPSRMDYASTPSWFKKQLASKYPNMTAAERADAVNQSLAGQTGNPMTGLNTASIPQPLLGEVQEFTAPGGGKIQRQGNFLTDPRLQGAMGNGFGASSVIRDPISGIPMSVRYLDPVKGEYKTEPIPQDLRLNMSGLNNGQQDTVLKLAGTVRSSDVFKNFNIAQQNLDALKQAKQEYLNAKQGGGNVAVPQFAMMSAFIKLENPGAVIRETPVEMLKDSRGLSERAITYLKSLANGQQLSDQQMKEIQNMGMRYFRGYNNQWNSMQKDAVNQAKQAGIPEAKAKAAISWQPNDGGDVESQKSATTPNTAVNPRTGERLVLRNGKWTAQ
jgi:hypothetical protein